MRPHERWTGTTLGASRDALLFFRGQGGPGAWYRLSTSSAESFMAGIVELFGYSPQDQSPTARQARLSLHCPFIGEACTKKLGDGEISGACTIESARSGPVMCCPVRLYAHHYQILLDVARIAFGDGIPLLPAGRVTSSVGERIAVLDKRCSSEFRLPARGGCDVDWVLARISPSGQLVDFVAVQVEAIETKGNYRAEQTAHMSGQNFIGRSTAQPNWEPVNTAILPQLIYKGHVLRQEPLCLKGLFFVCPTPVYKKVLQRLGGEPSPYPLQPGTLTILWYDLGPPVLPGRTRDLVPAGRLTTSVDQVALAFSAPRYPPPPQFFESVIRAQLSSPDLGKGTS
jgi:hypothetical protein